jgi:hypothetical protein
MISIIIYIYINKLGLPTNVLELSLLSALVREIYGEIC